MKIKIEIEVDTSTDLDERDALLDLLTTVKEQLMGEYYEED
jgi:hypothetical protein|tara:strand:- start:3249 stop:3371 length:123 start_codon:yes stop_codon:yes gene_type:complete